MQPGSTKLGVLTLRGMKRKRNGGKLTRGVVACFSWERERERERESGSVFLLPAACCKSKTLEEEEEEESDRMFIR